MRSSYGLFYDQFQNGSGTASQVRGQRHPVGAVQPVQRRRPELPESLPRAAVPRARDVRAAVDGVRASTPTRSRRTRRTGTSSVQRSLARPLPGRSALRRRHRPQPAAQRRSQPGGLRSRRDGAERRPPAPLRQLPGRRRQPCDFSTIAMLRNITSARLPRRPGERVAALRRRRRLQRVLLVFASRIDELSAMNLSGAAAKPLAGENDLAQNPFDLEAEYGPSLFDARHRFVASASWEPRLPAAASAALQRLARRLADQRHRHPQLGHAVHRLGLGQRRAAGQQPADLRLRGQPAEPRRRSERRRRAPSTSGSADRRSSASIRRRRPASSATPAATSRAARPTPTSTCRWCATSR